MIIRYARTEDYPAIADIHNTAEPTGSMTDTAESVRHLDESMDAKYNLRRYVADLDGAIVGTARCSNFPQWYHPQRFSMYIAVRPEYQGQGIGKAIYRRIRGDIEPHNPVVLRAFYREDTERTGRFLSERGFVEDMRMWESWVELDAFDPEQYEPTIESVLRSGIRFRTFKDVQSDPDWENRLYELIVHIQADMPSPEAYTPMSFEFFKNVEIGRPTLIPDGYFVAVDGDRYVGVSVLHRDDNDPTRLNTDDTGVHRDYRRRGVATALKVTGLNWAKAHGKKRVYTMNESTNQPMLALNTMLGFQRMPARVGVVLRLGSD